MIVSRSPLCLENWKSTPLMPLSVVSKNVPKKRPKIAKSRMCFVCEKTGPRSYHRFPVDLRLKASWMNFCFLVGTVLRPQDKTNNLLICGYHFKSSDYLNVDKVKPSTVGKRYPLQLKKGAVPSIFNGKEVDLNENLSTETLDIIAQNADEETRVNANSNFPTAIREFVIIGDSCEEVIIENENLPSLLPAPTRTFIDPIDKPGIGSLGKRKYPGDFKIEDMESPEKARKYFKITQEMISKNACKMKNLQQKNRRFLRRINYLKRMNKVLSGKNILFDDN